jgi:hypothetical protein
LPRSCQRWSKACTPMMLKCSFRLPLDSESYFPRRKILLLKKLSLAVSSLDLLSSFDHQTQTCKWVQGRGIDKRYNISW